MSSMSHTSGTYTINCSFTLKSKESSSYVNVGGVGGRNYTLRLVNPLAKLFLESKS